MKAFIGSLKFFRRALSRIDVIVNRRSARIMYLFPFVFVRFLKGSKNF